LKQPDIQSSNFITLQLENQGASTKAFFYFLLFSSFFHLEKILLGPYAPIRMHDSFATQLPRYLDVVRLLKQYGTFFWYPNVAGGGPVYSDHFGVTYILNFLSMITPLWFVQDFITILLMTIAGFGMYWFLRMFFSYPNSFALAGGFLFALNSQLQQQGTIHQVYTFAFPLTFTLLHYLPHNEERKPGLVLRVISLLLIAWLSYPILTPPFMILHFIVLLFVGLRHRDRICPWLQQFSLFWIGYFCLCQPTLHTLLDYQPFLNRNFSELGLVEVYTEGLTHRMSALSAKLQIISANTFLFPVLIGSTVLLFFSREVRRNFYLWVVTIFLLWPFLLVDETDMYKRLFSDTILQKVDLNWLRLIIPFTATLYALSAIYSLRDQTPRIKLFFSLIAFGALYFFFIHQPHTVLGHGSRLLVLMIINFLILAGVLLYSFIKPMPFSLFLNFSNRKRVLLLFLIVTLVSGILLTVKFLRFHQYDNKIYKRHFDSYPALRDLHSETKREPFRVGVVGARPALAGFYGLETLGGHAPAFNLYYKDYFRLIISPYLDRNPVTKEFFKNQENRLWLQANRFINHPEFKYKLIPKAEDFNFPLLLAANVKYLISYRPIVGMGKHALSVQTEDGEWYGESQIWNEGLWEFMDRLVSRFEALNIGPVGRQREPMQLFIYELKNYVPRAYLASNITVLPTREKVLETLKDQNITVLRNTAYLAKEDVDFPESVLLSNNNLNSDNNSIRISNYEPDRISISITVDSPKMVVITNNYYQKWKATINGTDTQILRVNHAFQGVNIPQAGQFKLELTYSEPKLDVAFLIMPLGLIFIFLSVYVERPHIVFKNYKDSQG